MCVLRDAALDGRRVDCVRRGRFAPRTTLRVLLLFPSRGKRVDRPLKRHPRRTVFDFEERKKEEGRHAIRKRVRCAEECAANVSRYIRREGSERVARRTAKRSEAARKGPRGIEAKVRNNRGARGRAVSPCPLQLHENEVSLCGGCAVSRISPLSENARKCYNIRRFEAMV